MSLCYFYHPILSLRTSVNNHPHRPLAHSVSTFRIEQPLSLINGIYRDMVRLLPGGNQVLTGIIDIKAAWLGFCFWNPSTARTLPSSDTLKMVIMLAVRSQV